MTTTKMPTPVIPPNLAARKILVPRHAVIVRVTHWLNVLCFSLLLMTGAQIFNAHPRLYWGQFGADNDAAWLSIDAVRTPTGTKGRLRIGPLTLTTTGVLGASVEDGSLTARAFPAWLTIPSYQDLAAGRRWHFFFAWLFVLNGVVYLGAGLLKRHFVKDLRPTRSELAPARLWREVVDHARLRFARGEQARHYNVLQKLTYLAVVFVLLPLMVLTGWTMSPGLDSAFHVLLDVFGGRASARSIHFICASLLLAFVVVHVVMVVASGLWNNLRSMVSGQYAIDVQRDES
jgi:thiosulfate reductase cytochrome b subunit